MERYWHKDPSMRPSANMIFNTVDKWVKDLTFDRNTKNKIAFLKADQEMQNLDFELSSVETIHSEAYLTSHHLPSVYPLASVHPSPVQKFDINNINWDDYIT